VKELVKVGQAQFPDASLKNELEAKFVKAVLAAIETLEKEYRNKLLPKGQSLNSNGLNSKDFYTIFQKTAKPPASQTFAKPKFTQQKTIPRA